MDREEQAGVFYLSFAADDDDGAFLGGCVVEAEGMHDAVRRSHALGINPASETPSRPCEALVVEVPPGFREKVKPYMDRLLTRAEIDAMDNAMLS